MADRNTIEKKDVAIAGEDAPQSASRRRLLRNGVASMPVILTLHSGAALARSSNLLSAASTFEVDGNGRTLCVDLNSLVPVDDYSQIYDLGDPPHVVINVIRGEAEGRLYYVQKDDKEAGNPVHPGLMCEQGGEYWYKPASGPWEPINIPRGFVASSMAASSFTSSMTDTLI